MRTLLLRRVCFHLTSVIETDESLRHVSNYPANALKPYHLAPPLTTSQSRRMIVLDKTRIRKRAILGKPPPPYDVKSKSKRYSRPYWRRLREVICFFTVSDRCFRSKNDRIRPIENPVTTFIFEVAPDKVLGFSR